MPDSNQHSLKISLAICLDREAMDRYKTVLRHFVVGLVDSSMQVRLVSSDSRVERLRLGPIQVVRHARLAWPFRTSRLDALISDLQSSAPSIIHAFGGDTFGRAFSLAEAFDADLVIGLTCSQDLEQLGLYDLGRVQRFVSHSSPLSLALLDQHGVGEERSWVIHPGVRTATSCKSFAAGRIPAILCTTPFERGSGVDQLLRAVRQVIERGRTVMLFLLGSGPLERRYRQLVRELGLSAYVTFANPLGDASDAMDGSEIFVNPGVSPGAYVDVLRAMGMGMAVITRSDPMVDYYRHEENALICNPCNASTMAEALFRLLDDVPFARQLASGGLEYVKSTHMMSGMADRLIEMYRSLALNRATFSIKE
ncbi:MAG: glycosyltransferase family 4 protein [Phycisphaerae bacterium]